MAAIPGPGGGFAGAGSGGLGPKAEASVTTDDSDDDISVTSTLYESEDSQTEYEVEDILAQEADADGVTKYLVKWANYPLEMCTWEPEENISDGLLHDVWEAKRNRPDYQPFDLALLSEAYRARDERHLRRNAKRARLGLPRTPPFVGNEAAWAGAGDSFGAKDGGRTAGDAAAVSGGAAAGGAATDGAAGFAAASATIMNSTEISSGSDDDLVVIEERSAPPKKKKDKKKKAKKASASPSDGIQKKDKKRTAASEAPADKKSKKAHAPPLPLAAKGPPAPAARADVPAKERRPEKRGCVDHAARPDAATAHSSITARHPPPAAGRDALSAVPKPTARLPNPAKAPVETAAKGPVTPSRPPGPSTSTAAASGAKTFSARKSGSASHDFGGNAFTGGKKIRAGNKLASVMSDPARLPQLFPNRRALRRAELTERDKPDRAIELSALNAALFPITQGPPAVAPLPHARGQPQKAAPEAASLAALHPPTANPDAPAAAPLKRKKSVRFADDTDDGRLILGRTRLRSPPVPGSGLADGNEDGEMPMETDEPAGGLPDRNVELLIGEQGGLVAAVASVTTQQGATPAMVEDVFAEQPLRFDHVCLAETLKEQMPGIRKEVLFAGGIAPPARAPSSTAQLGALAERLRAMASGLLLLQPAYAVLVYPAHCEEWAESLFGFPALASTAAAAALRYVVFSTFFDGTAFLRPLQCAVDVDALAGEHDRMHLMRQFFQLDRTSYLALLPGGAQRPEARRNVFLVFPPTLDAAALQLILWLREVDPDCAVSYSSAPGAWMAFVDRVAGQSETGVIIVHELVIGAVRRFPDLSRLLRARSADCRFWSLSQGIRSPPVFTPMQVVAEGAADPSSRGHKGSEQQHAFGRLAFAELFPQGSVAVLVTPSFILSEPRRVFELFDWAAAAVESGTMTVVLVAAWDLCSYLREVAEEKLRLRKAIQADKTLETSAEQHKEAARLGATEGQCRYRAEAWLLASALSSRLTKARFRWLHGAQRPGPVVFVDEAIDSNDEQSLVNWFGWWSTIHLDRFGAFFVAGSSMERNDGRPAMISRRIPVPKFSPDTVSDPDVARERIDETLAAMSPAPDQGGASASAAAAAAAAPAAAPAAQPKTAAPGADGGGGSVRHPEMSLTALTPKLMRLNRASDFWRIYGHPVWWRDAEEAYQAGCIDGSKYTIQAWFNFTWTFSDTYRAYVGLFCLAEAPLPSARPAGADGGKVYPATHPWVVIYRPVNSHLKKACRKTELIFWDVRAKCQFRGRDVLRETHDLTAGQRALVEYVRRHGATKNRGSYVSRVFIGGEPHRPGHLAEWEAGGGGAAAMSSSAAPTAAAELDATMQYAEALAGDYKQAMPPTLSYLEARGFKEVILKEDARLDAGGGDSEGSGGSSSKTRSAGTDERPSGEAADDVKFRVVFHPPAGSRPGHIGSSLCRNRLFESTRLLRKVQLRPSPTMQFEFVPTPKWYLEQLKEDRGFEHVHVGSWEDVFATYTVGKDG